MSKARTLLLVEDEADTREILNWWFMSKGFRIEEAVDGEQGLMKARKLKPALIVLDIMLPKMDGFQVYQALRQDARTRDIPVLFLTAALSSTGYLSKEGIQAAAHSKYGFKLEGPYDVMAKPHEGEQLEGKLHRLLELADALERRKKAV